MQNPFRYAHNLSIAFESLRGNRLRTYLTTLGIVFGVAAVISMLAIGSGAQQEILSQMELVGVNNLIVNAVSRDTKASGSGSGGEGEEAGSSGRGNRGGKSGLNRFSPGLTRQDVEAIRRVIPEVDYVAGVVSYSGSLSHANRKLQGLLLGVDRDYFSIYHLGLASGIYFSALHERTGAPVCVIGERVRAQLLRDVEPIGARVKFDGVWYTVVGVLSLNSSAMSLGGAADLGIADFNSAIFVPLRSLDLRYIQRGSVSARDRKRILNKIRLPDHELERIVVHVSDARYMRPVQEVINRLLTRLHLGVDDFSVIIPEELLKQQQRTRDIFNLVLGAIAGISLLVGGIGIMNIMFATVLERTREIGTRRAIGAQQNDIVVQFLGEAVFISVIGGLIGVVLGVVLSYTITHFAEIETVVTWGAVLLAFGVSAGIGILFGFWPARRAARRSPIESLRYE